MPLQSTVIEFQRMSYMITDRIVVLDLGPDALGAGVFGCPPTCGTGDESVYRAAGQFAPEKSEAESLGN